jgi:glycerophosphoryl diester phosphodiesterase
MRGWMGWWGRTFGWHGGMDALNPFHTDVNASLVDRVHAAGKRVYVWTVNAEDDIKRMISLGVDGIITDDPGLALRLLGRAG